MTKKSFSYLVTLHNTPYYISLSFTNYIHGEALIGFSIIVRFMVRPFGFSIIVTFIVRPFGFSIIVRFHS